MQDPFRQGNWRQDPFGVQAPMGSGHGAKIFMELPKEIDKSALATNILIRGKFTRELWSDLAMLNAIAPHHKLTQIFIASVTAGSMAENGQATTNALQSDVKMLVPGALSPYYAQLSNRRQESRRFGKNHEGKVIEEDNE